MWLALAVSLAGSALSFWALRRLSIGFDHVEIRILGTIPLLLAGFVSIFVAPLFDYHEAVAAPHSEWLYYVLFLISCGLYAFYNALRVRLIKVQEEISSVLVSLQCTGIWLVFIGVNLFGEAFSFMKQAGVGVFFLGNIIYFFRRNGWKLFNWNFLIGILTSVVLAVAITIDKAICPYFNPALYAAGSLIVSPIFMASLPPIAKLLSKFRLEVTRSPWLYFLASLGFLFSTIGGLIALSGVHIAIFGPLRSVSLVINFLVAYFFLSEKNNFSQKLIATVVMVLGCALIAL